MTVSEFITAAWRRAKGKNPTFAAQSTKWNLILDMGNDWTRYWATEYGVDFNSLYDPRVDIGNVIATDTFELDSSIRKLSDKLGDVVRIMHTDGVGYTDYTIVPHDDLKMYYGGQDKESPSGFYCAQMGRDLVFNHEFISTDQQYGGSIEVPAYLYPDVLENATDDIQVDNPDWLVLIVASELARNDVTRQSQYPALLAQANDKMNSMKDDNDAQLSEVTRPWNPGGSSW